VQCVEYFLFETVEFAVTGAVYDVDKLTAEIYDE